MGWKRVLGVPSSMRGALRKVGVRIPASPRGVLRQMGMGIPASLPGLMRSMGQTPRNSGWQQPSYRGPYPAPLPGMPGWVPPSVPPQRAAGPTSQCWRCGFGGASYLDGAVGYNGLFQWCSQCHANLGYAPPQANTTKTILMLLCAAVMGACCVIACGGGS